LPFGTCTWVEGQPQLDLAAEPKPELRHLDGKWFRLLNSFCYRPPPRDPDHDEVFVVPGADAPRNRTAHTTKQGAFGVVIPPNPSGGKTDIASVPWFMWWLVASYGNHTKAALLHDALVVDKGTPPVPRTMADRLFLTALREPGQKTGAFRHWLMWAAVAAFGTMPRALAAVFVGSLVAVWGLLGAALAWAWAPAIWPQSLVWQIAVVAAVVAGLSVVLVMLGTFWRAGVDHTGGWLSPSAAIATVIAVPLWLEWSKPVELSPTALLIIAGVLTIAGFAWGLAVDRTLRWWLWPTALLGLPIALTPALFIFVAATLVWFIDVGAEAAASFAAGRRFHWPSLKPYRLPL
jgi:Protein of unknown function (DUF1353)